MNMDHEQLQEMLDLKKVEVLTETMARLEREMTAYHVLSRKIAWAKSREVTDQLELTVPEAPATADGNGQTVDTVSMLTVQRRKVMEAMRATLYHGTNRMKQYSQQGKDAFERNRAAARDPTGAEAVVQEA